MKLSARNQFQGTVIEITEGQAMAEVVVKVGILEIRGGDHRRFGQKMGMKVNDAVTGCSQSDRRHDREIACRESMSDSRFLQVAPVASA